MAFLTQVLRLHKQNWRMSGFETCAISHKSLTRLNRSAWTDVVVFNLLLLRPVRSSTAKFTPNHHCPRVTCKISHYSCLHILPTFLKFRQFMEGALDLPDPLLLFLPLPSHPALQLKSWRGSGDETRPYRHTDT